MRKRNEYSRAFGSAPEAFKGRVADALHELQEEKPMRKASIRTVLIMALVGILLVGAAYAAVSQLGLVDYFAGQRNMELSEDAQRMLTFDAPLYRTTLGDFDVEITSAVADGRCWYVSAVFTPNTDAAAMVGMRDADVETPPEGVTGYVAELACSSSNDVMQSYDYVLSDGAILMYTDGAMEDVTGDAVTLQGYIAIAEAGPEGWPQEPDLVDHFTLELPFSAPIGTRRATGLPVEIEGMGGTIDLLELTMTPLTTYFHMEYTVTEETAMRSGSFTADFMAPRYTPQVILTDAAGEWLPFGDIGWGDTRTYDEYHYTASGTLGLEVLPDVIHVRALESNLEHGVMAIVLEAVE